MWWTNSTGTKRAVRFSSNSANPPKRRLNIGADTHSLAHVLMLRRAGAAERADGGAVVAAVAVRHNIFSYSNGLSNRGVDQPSLCNSELRVEDNSLITLK